MLYFVNMHRAAGAEHADFSPHLLTEHVRLFRKAVAPMERFLDDGEIHDGAIAEDDDGELSEQAPKRARNLPQHLAGEAGDDGAPAAGDIAGDVGLEGPGVLLRFERDLVSISDRGFSGPTF